MTQLVFALFSRHYQEICNCFFSYVFSAVIDFITRPLLVALPLVLLTTCWTGVADNLE